MTPAMQSVLAKIEAAKAKVALTIHNDRSPSARLMASVILLNQAIEELRGGAGDPKRSDDTQ